MATPQSIATQGTPTKTAIDMRTDSQWWYFAVNGNATASVSASTTTTAIPLASAFR